MQPAERVDWLNFCPHHLGSAAGPTAGCHPAQIRLGLYSVYVRLSADHSPPQLRRKLSKLKKKDSDKNSSHIYMKMFSALLCILKKRPCDCLPLFHVSQSVNGTTACYTSLLRIPSLAQKLLIAHCSAKSRLNLDPKQKRHGRSLHGKSLI